MAGRPRKTKIVTDEEKSALLSDILEKRFSCNQQDGLLLPLGMSKSTSAISGLLLQSPEDGNQQSEIALPLERAQIKLSYMIDRDHNVSSKAILTAFDREVHDAIISLYSTGIRTFTPTMVYTVMVGKGSMAQVKPTPSQLSRIESSIYKCIINRISITFELDGEAELQFKELMHNGEKGKVRIEQPLLNLANGEFIVGNARCNAYQFVTPPALLEYAMARNCVQLIPNRLLALPMSFTDYSISARGVISQKILECYATGKGTCVIGFTEIDPGYESAYKQKKSRLRQITTNILDFWKEQRFIKDYAYESTRGKEITIISITLNSEYSSTEYIDFNRL